jgi:hypothetical protein
VRDCIGSLEVRGLDESRRGQRRILSIILEVVTNRSLLWAKNWVLAVILSLVLHRITERGKGF